jgi:adenylate cyclase
MSWLGDYTTRALRFTARFPVFTVVSFQMNFWIIANMFLVVIMHLQTRLIDHAYQLSITGPLGHTLFLAAVLGALYGICLGFTDYFLDKHVLRKWPLGKLIVFKAVISLSVLILLLWLVRFVMSQMVPLSNLGIPPQGLSREAWDTLFVMMVIYYFFMTLVINFIIQVNKKYGPGVLLPLLLGRYRRPREERRIFMFMDLKSSTAIAERLGHLSYSAFISDAFADINQVLLTYRAEVYQYAGDEIVLSWVEEDGMKDLLWVRFYFACKAQLEKRAEYYLQRYGIIPEFKAGVHAGLVTAVEIGEIKRDIAYHGDTLNTAARIQSLCNDYRKQFLVSAYVLTQIGAQPGLTTSPLGDVTLKGKTTSLEIASIEAFI